MLLRRFQRRFQFYVIPFLVCPILLTAFLRDAYSLTAEEEKKMGKTVLLEIQREADFMRDLTIQTFIEKLGYSIVDQVGPTPFEFRFYVIDALEPNAFAIPGGYIFVTTGLLVLAENEQEIAGVLGHEIAHVTQRHVAQMIERSKRLNIASMVAMLAAMLAGRGGAGSQAGIAMATATAGALALKYSREMETDADQNGLHYLIKAGYDPNGLINFLNRLQRISLAIAPNIPAYLLTHPATENRISLMENLLQMGPRPTGPFRTVPNFKKIRAMAFVEEREPQVAVTHFQSFIDANPDSWEGYYGLGLAYRKMGRFDKSIEVLQRAHSVAPQDVDISRELGITYFFGGKPDQSIESLEALRNDLGEGRNSDLMILYYLGRGYQEKGDFARALPLLLRVQKEKPEFIDIYYYLGSAYGRAGQKGLSHFYFGKHFKSKREKNNALLHFRTAIDGLERGSPEREEAQREIKELTSRQ
ncbi:MAG TPA: M48 family metalloprotease [Thermodesulfobacteriota bacterium]|nr:M48 family metalloprotease [Thermodesulfobacteriota bacterium]